MGKSAGGVGSGPGTTAQITWRRVAAALAAFRRHIAADRPDAVIRIWDGRNKAFGTRPLYVSVAAAATAVAATIVVVAVGVGAAAATILVVGVGVPALAVWLCPPVHCVATVITDVNVGDLVAPGDGDFVVHASPVVAIMATVRGGQRVLQVATAAGAAHEADYRGVLSVIHSTGLIRPASALETSARRRSESTAWPWAPLVGEILARLLPHQRDGLPAPSRDQVRADLVARANCTRATARHALRAATGLGLVTAGGQVSATPAGAVWFASWRHGIGSRIDAPAEKPWRQVLRPGAVSESAIRIPSATADVSDHAGHSSVIDLSATSRPRSADWV